MFLINGILQIPVDGKIFKIGEGEFLQFRANWPQEYIFRFRIYGFILMAVVFSADPCFSGENSPGTDKRLDAVTLHLKWKHQFQFAGYYAALEKYISEHSEAQFSHGICEACLKEHYPQMAD